MYVGDRENRRIQVFDNDGNFKSMYINVGAPWAICITPGPHEYLYSSNSNGTADMDNGEIYKMELGGKILGKFGTAGKQLKEFGSVHEIDCRNPNEIYVGELHELESAKTELASESSKVIIFETSGVEKAQLMHFKKLAKREKLSVAWLMRKTFDEFLAKRRTKNSA